MKKQLPPELLSGPISAYRFAGPAGQDIWLFGDAHFSYDNLCSRCTPERHCRDITEFIQDAIDHVGQLDVLMEFPYVPRSGARRSKVLSSTNRLLRRNAHISTKVHALFSKIIDMPGPQYIGVFSVLYQQFGDKFYGVHDTSQSKRFHYADARTDAVVMRLLKFPADIFSSSQVKQDYVRLLTGLPTVQHWKHLLEAFVFATDFRAAVMDATKDTPGMSWVGDVPDAELARPPGITKGARRMHRIAKQFAKLPEGPLKEATHAFIMLKMTQLCDLMREPLSYDALAPIAAKRLASAHPKKDGDTHVLAFMKGFQQILFQFNVFLMDQYLVCRMAYYTFVVQATKPGTTIVYAGDDHTTSYMQYCRDFLGLTPLLSKPASSWDEDVTRCISL